MKAVPEKGRDATGKGRADGPSRGNHLAGLGSSLGLSIAPAKWFSLPVGADLRLDLDPRRGPARLSSRYGESVASAAGANVEGRRAPDTAASRCAAKRARRADDKALAAFERLPAGGVSK